MDAVRFHKAKKLLGEYPYDDMADRFENEALH